MSLRQESVLARVSQRVEASRELEGALLIGSLAAGTADHLSDVDLLVVVGEDQFRPAWAERRRLEGDEAIAACPGGAIFAAGGVEVLVHEPSRASAREVAPHTRGTCRPSRRASADVELVSF